MTEEESIRYLEERLKENPKSLLFARLAEFYVHRGRIDEAIELCSQGIQHHPDYLTGHYILGKAYDTKGDQEKAEAEYKKVLSHDCHYLAAHKALGDMMLAMGWEDKAALHYREILRIDPLEEEIHELLNSLTLGSESVEDVAVKEQKGSMNFRPISTIETESEENENWGNELEKIVTEDKNESVSEEPFTASEEIQDEFKADEKRSDTEEEPTMDTVLEGESPPMSKEEVPIETSEKKEDELKEKDNLIFEISDESIKEDTVEKSSDSVSETELFSPDSLEDALSEEKVESESTPLSDSEDADRVDSQPTESLIGEKEIEIDSTPSTDNEPSIGEEAFTLDINEKETERAVDNVQDSEFSPASEDVKESENEKGPDAVSLSPEDESVVGEEEFSFDFEEEETEGGDDQRMSPSIQKGKKEISDTPASNEKEPSAEEMKKGVEEEHVDSSKSEKETEDKPKSEELRGSADVQSSEKHETEKSLEPTEKKSVQEETKIKDKKDGGKDKEQKIISPTLGEIYKAQGQYAKAIRIYETLLKKSPQEKRYQDEIDQLKQKLKD